MNQVLIATSDNSNFDLASSQVLNRSLLYNKDSQKLFIKYNGEMVPISKGVSEDNVDNFNIILEDGKVSLKPHVICENLTVKPNVEDSLKHVTNKYLGKTTNNLFLLFKKNTTQNSFLIGDFYFSTPVEKSVAHLSLISKGEYNYFGTTTTEGDSKFNFVKVISSNDTEFYGFQLPNVGDSYDVYFTGYMETAEGDEPTEDTYNDVREILVLRKESNTDAPIIIIPPETPIVPGEIDDTIEETGEQGDPNVIKIKGQVLSLNDLNQIASTLKRKNYQITLDLSECTVNNTLVNITTDIFSGCISLKSIILPSGIQNINSRLFYRCTSLESVTLPETLVGINADRVFFLTSVRDLYLPRSLTSFGAQKKPFIDSDIARIYIHSESTANWNSITQNYGLFYKTDPYDASAEHLTIYMPQNIRNTFNNSSWQINHSYLGISFENMVVYTDTSKPYGEFTQE